MLEGNWKNNHIVYVIVLTKEAAKKEKSI